MSPLAFVIVDVFAEAPLSGNPLAVVLGAEDLPDDLLAKVAREFNQSETTFLLPARDPEAVWRLRSFTAAGSEVVGAGHNALGAWWWLAADGRLQLDAGGGRFLQEIGGRTLPVEALGFDVGPGTIWLDQATPRFGRSAVDLDGLTAALGLERDALAAGAPPRVVSTGAPHLLVPVRDRSEVDRARLDAPRLAAALAAVGGQGCYLYSLDALSPDAVAYARFFNPTVGLWEDPATGSAAGPLAARLVSERILANGTTAYIEQGGAMGRPSRIEVQVNGPEVRIGGSGVTVAEGTMWV